MIGAEDLELLQAQAVLDALSGNDNMCAICDDKPINYRFAFHVQTGTRRFCSACFNAFKQMYQISFNDQMDAIFRYAQDQGCFRSRRSTLEFWADYDTLRHIWPDPRRRW